MHLDKSPTLSSGRSQKHGSLELVSEDGIVNSLKNEQVVMITLMVMIMMRVTTIMIDNNKNNNNNNNNNITNDDDDNNNDDDNRIERRSLRFLQSPHCATNCLQHARPSGRGAIMCKSRATHRSLIRCNMCDTWYEGTAQLLRKDTVVETNATLKVVCWLVA